MSPALRTDRVCASRSTPALFMLSAACALFVAAPALAQPVGIFTDHKDLGIIGTDPAVPGDATLDSTTGTYTVTGGGSDWWNEGEFAHFVYTPRSGPFRLEANVNVQGDPANDWAKFGVAMRNDVDTGDGNEEEVNYLMAVTDPFRADPRGAFQFRHVQNENMGNIERLGAQPSRVAIQRYQVGGTWRVEGFMDVGNGWERLGRVTAPNLLNDVFAGLAVTSHDNSRTETATFTNVQFLDAVIPPPPPTPNPLQVGVEDFEVDRTGRVGYSTRGEGVGNADQFFTTSNNPSITPPSFMGQQAAVAFVGSQMNQAFADGASVDNPRRITLNPVNVAGLQDVRVTAALAASGNGAGGGPWENVDFLRVAVRGLDGAGNEVFDRTIINFTGAGSLINTEGEFLSPTYADFTGLVGDLAGATNLEIRIESLSSATDEQIGVDAIRVTAIPEPAGVTVLAAAASLLLRRRRKLTA